MFEAGILWIVWPLENLLLNSPTVIRLSVPISFSIFAILFFFLTVLVLGTSVLGFVVEIQAYV